LGVRTAERGGLKRQDHNIGGSDNRRDQSRIDYDYKDDDEDDLEIITASERPPPPLPPIEP